MLEYFSYKKAKKHREEKAAAASAAKEKQKPEDGTAKGKEKEKEKEKHKEAPSETPKIISTPADDDDNAAIEGTPVLDHEDEKFLERLTSSSTSLPVNDDDDNEDEVPPPLPPRVKTPVMDIDSDDDKSSTSSKKDSSTPSKSKAESKSQPQDKGKEKEKEQDKSPSTTDHKLKRFTFSLRRKPKPSTAGLHPSTTATLTVPEARSETSDMAHLLDDLDLSAKNNRAFSLSSESAEMARRFTQVLRDVVAGVPTAYGDLVSLIEDRDGVLARNYERLPSGLKKLVAQLPDKLTSTLAPELLAVAAEAQGLDAASHKEGGLKDAAKKFLTPGNLHELVTKPGALVGLLKGIVNALKTRFPAFVGTNVLWSLAVFLLLSMLWYCHKRGREVRLEREAEEEKAQAGAEGGGKGGGDGDGGDTIEGKPRVEELPDDPMLPAATASAPVPAPVPVAGTSGAAPDATGAREGPKE
ncbi:hypothetical protein F4859DRAFT_521141 [Xylaria cf. heliscus]|nr:hypothetical protein F4859DRAFT_521141 [Xylaria cf. heliscus]